MTEAERTNAITTIRAMSIEQAEQGVFISKRNLIEVEAEIAAKTQALAAITSLGTRQAFKRLPVLQKLRSLAGRKAEIEWFREEYTQRVNGRERKEPRSSAMTRAKRALDNPDKHPNMTAEEVRAIMGIGRSTVYDLVNKKEKLEKVSTGGRRWLVTTESVRNLLDSSPD
jgi:predicted DNA-binding transcriptional regulator AlpA